MVKIGQTDATVDPQFNQLESEFKDQYNKIKKFGKYVDKYQASLKGKKKTPFFLSFPS